ncbi:unnamed protein product [Heligmosomoides polygyrus]|uniref:Uncharacterized protein n=1 Tax=Heligmosomoides polygyrus TaxID=6339 RepID=A0A183FKF6_HELPZ|nr:unnamed protein product [Heligmosomoides polygyrus]
MVRSLGNDFFLEKNPLECRGFFSRKKSFPKDRTILEKRYAKDQANEINAKRATKKLILKAGAIRWNSRETSTSSRKTWQMEGQPFGRKFNVEPLIRDGC